ncbi:hypothetical protein ORV05_12920 [Amycolatopsis cynarae]|uniref:tRNA-guanine(15) transglycosylase-like domain-containing protein n=1 Tax=Amycolatopsis cynarae TaxID=2995223 RepID=A0ABY7BBM0_9PSEU|nr:hypothetical protein [Amycolatopsis sp. HUAS 11-8]WAL68632.1 hypothetical protein ORV05_12920 [Amycolatopsis sp. HUAS 11-8]
MGGALDQLTGRLLIQCRSAHALTAAEIATAHRAGLVVTGGKPEQAVGLLRGRGFAGPILCDADRYSGKKRVTAGCGIRPAWCGRQRELGLIPVTDSGYLDKQNWPGLRTILRAAARQPPPVIAMLPVAARWFDTDAIRDAFIEEINKYQVPVAVAIERQGDPFGAQYVARGFLRLVREAAVPVLLLRSDVSALGALCHGAHAAAIGTVSTLRHIHPISRWWPADPGVSAFVTPLLSYHKLDRIEEVVEKTPDLAQLWPCACPVCADSTPVRLRESENPQEPAYRHSLHAQLRLRAELFGRARTREALVSTWHEHCSHALAVHKQVAEVIPGWREPEGLKSWLAVTEDPLARRREIPPQPQTKDPRLTDTQ